MIFCCYAKCILSRKRGMEMPCDKRWRNWFRILLRVVRREAKKLMFFDRLQHCPRVKSINARQQGTGHGFGCQQKLSKNRGKDFSGHSPWIWGFASAITDRKDFFSLSSAVIHRTRCNGYQSLNYFIAHDLSLSVVEQNNSYSYI